MGKAAPKLVLSPSRDIPFNQLVLSQRNVRTVKSGVSIGELALDIARRTLLQSLNVRPILDDAGAETGMFEVPAGGRRFRALELLVAQKRLAKDAPIPCVVRTPSSNEDSSAEEDSLAENVFREQLHPLDQFRAMQVLVDQGVQVEDIAARFMTTSAVVRQRLKLASVSPVLCELYAKDEMTLDQLMAFSVTEDHGRQEQVWNVLAKHWDRSAGEIRRRLTETSVHASNRRVAFIGLDAYVAAGGTVMRDLFEDDRGGWLQDVGLLDQLVMEKLGAEGERIGAEGWKWVSVAMDFAYGHDAGMRQLHGAEVPISHAEQAVLDALQDEMATIEAQHGQNSDVPDEVNARYEAVQREMMAIHARPTAYDPVEMARAGAFVSLASDGSLQVERGFVKSEDEPVADGEQDGEHARDTTELSQEPSERTAIINVAGDAGNGMGEDEEELALKPLPDRLVSELTTHRTLALENALATNPKVAYIAVLHAMALSVFYYASRESCVALSVTGPQFMHQEPGLAESPSARANDERHAYWKGRLPKSDRDLWDALLLLNADEQADLLAHCAAHGVNAVWEAVGRYDNGRISPHTIERRIAHSHVLARAVKLDMVAAGWQPTVDNYFGRVTKPQILAAVEDAKGEETAGLIDHLKKGDMAREAARLLDGSKWLPAPLRTPGLDDVGTAAGNEPDDVAELDTLPAFLDDGGEGAGVGQPELGGAEYAIAAE
jgi:ParB family chromosome partitioning protein